jgi:hypothetical protein
MNPGKRRLIATFIRSGHLREGVKALLDSIPGVTVTDLSDRLEDVTGKTLAEHPALIIFDMGEYEEKGPIILKCIFELWPGIPCLSLLDEVCPQEPADKAGLYETALIGTPAEELFNQVKGLLYQENGEKAVQGTAYPAG